MTDIVATVPEPKAPCTACVENARHQDETFGLVWCEHVRYGGMYFVEQGQWQIVGPFENEQQFKRAMYSKGTRRI
jgi:hypothetical protein